MRKFLTLALLILAPRVGLGQLNFDVPLHISCANVTNTIRLGITSTAHFCIEGDSINGSSEFFLPPVPPQGIVDVRFVCPRTPYSIDCFDQGSWCDFRSYTDSSQRDTFRIRVQSDGVNTVSFTWPQDLSTYFRSAQLGNVDMLHSFGMTLGDGTYWMYTEAIGGSGTHADSVPSLFRLYQNFPNPFNSSTRIEYDLPRTGRVSIQVFDITGRQVAVLVDEVKPARQHTTVWDAGAFSSGVYFVRMTAGSFTQERKILLLK